MRIGRRTAGVDIGIAGVSGASLIGQGGFGVVYRADHRALDRTVAIKILSAPGLDDDTRDRFERECAAIEALAGHPHVVAVFGSGTNRFGRPYLVMEYMARGSIVDRVARSGSLHWPAAAEIGIKIASAVSASHATGILHRDVKPQNVLLSAYDEPKLGDFGIASLGAEHTNSGSIAASVEHAAPELFDGGRASEASDIYALASTVYTMVAGRSPFARRSEESIQSVVARIVTDDVPDLRPTGVPGALCDALERGLAKEPAERFPSADEFAAALAEILEHHGLPAAPYMKPDPFSTRSRAARLVTVATGPTKPRLKRDVAGPVTPTSSPGRGRTLIVATLAGLLVAGGSAVAVISDRPSSSVTRPHAQAARTVELPAAQARPADGTQEKPDKPSSHRKRTTRARRKPTSSLGVSYGSGTTIAAAPGHGTSTSRGTGETTSDGDGGTRRVKPKPPPAPPAPDATLYHAFKGSDHEMFTDPGQRNGFLERGFSVQVVGGVYTYEAEGTRPIAINNTTIYVFAYASGETEPQTDRVQLYYMTSEESDDFYTTDEGTKRIYYGRGWNAQKPGWVAS